MTPFEVVVSRVGPVRPNGDGFIGRCPAHDDRKPSLAIRQGREGHVLVHCHAGCSVEQVCAALDLRLADLFPPKELGNESTRREVEAYRYVDEAGRLLYEVVRFAPKDFRQRRPDGRGGWLWKLSGTRRVLYRLPEVCEALKQGRWVVVVEGEKDADRLHRAEIVATCSPMGAGKWRDEYAESLVGAKVAILPDNDPKGHEHAEQVARSVSHVAAVVKVVELPDLAYKGDVYEWLETGHTADELKARIADAPEIEPRPLVAATNATDGPYLIRASQIEPEQVTYFDEGLIPLRVTTIMSGVDGVGKSTVLYTKAAVATRGKLPGAFHETPVDVVIASSEDHPGSVIIPRLVAAGADLERVHVVKCRKYGFEGDIALPEDLPAVAEQVKKVGARLLIVDPLVAHLPHEVDSYKAQHIRSVLAPLQRLCEESQLAAVAVVHFNGAPSTDVRTRMSGSKALRDAARSVLVCGEDPTDESRYVMVQDKHSFGPRPTTGTAYRIESREVEVRGKTFTTSAVVWLGEVEVSSRGLLAGPQDEGERYEVDRCADFLTDLLGDESMKGTDAARIAKQEGYSAATLKRGKKKAGVVSRKRGFGKDACWYWELESYKGAQPPSKSDEPLSDEPLSESVAVTGREATDCTEGDHSLEGERLRRDPAPEVGDSNTGSPSSEDDDRWLKYHQARADEVRRRRVHVNSERPA